jgi:hypothetical protein
MSDKQLPIVAWCKDGSLLIQHVPTRETALLRECDLAADALDLATADLLEAQKVMRRHNVHLADMLLNTAEVTANRGRDLRNALEKATNQ